MEPKTVYTVTRPTAVLFVAGLVLIFGAAILYQPLLRHPLSLFVIGVGVIGLGVAFPEPALAAAQLIIVGLLLVLVTGVLLGFLARPTPKRAVLRPVPPPPDSRASKPASSRSVVANSHMTTATLQPSAPLSATGNES